MNLESLEDAHDLTKLPAEQPPPCTLHFTPYVRHPTPYTLHPTTLVYCVCACGWVDNLESLEDTHDLARLAAAVHSDVVVQRVRRTAVACTERD